MGIGKILLIGGAVAGVAYLYVKHSHASALPTGPAAPSGPPIPPAGAATMSVPPGPKNPTGLTLTITQWQTPTGLTALVQNAANPQQDYVVSVGTAAGATITQRGTTQNSGLIAQSFVAGLLA
jgi:hypothetical protein